MKSLKFSVLGIAALFIFVTACSNKKFETTASGLQYKMHTKGDGKKPAVGDILTLQMVYKTELNDSVLFSTYDKKNPVQTMLSAPSFKGGIEEGFAMLGVGDSATFLIPADSLFTKTFHSKVPPFIKAGSNLVFIVKMEKFQSREQMDADAKAEADKSKAAEAGKIADYLKANNVTAVPTASGLYYIETMAGSGEKADTGKMVSVNYTGKFFDGKVFDSSQNSGKPIEFKLGGKQVIEGWEEGIKMMKKGGKATFIVPSQLAYAERGAKNPQNGEFIISPFTPLVFDVELVDVKKPETKKPEAKMGKNTK